MEVCIATLSGACFQLEADPDWMPPDLKRAVKAVSGGWLCCSSFLSGTCCRQVVPIVRITPLLKFKVMPQVVGGLAQRWILAQS